MGFDLAMHEATIVDLPFHGPEKRIPRGLEVATWPENLTDKDPFP